MLEGSQTTESGGAESAALTGLGKRVRERFEEAKVARKDYEDGWLEDLRQYRGVYSPEEKKSIDENRSRAFIRLTRSKVKTMDSRLMDIMFPAGGDKNWSIAPVSISPSDEEMVQAVSQKVVGDMVAQAAQQQGVPAQAIDPAAVMAEGQAVADDTQEKLLEDHKQRCERMEKVIDTQLSLSKYDKKCKAAVHSGNLYGTGILKGPLVEVRSTGAWKTDATGISSYDSRKETSPYLEAVSIWDIYPDMNGKEPEDLEYIIQRHVMMKSDLRALAKKQKFKGDVIRQYLKDNPEGDVETLTFESSIRDINSKLATTGTGVGKRGKRYEVLEYWGYVDGQDLADCGVDVPDEQLDQEFEANVWTLGSEVIKCVMNPFDACIRPYHFFYFEKDETSIFGSGIAEIMRTVQRVFNASIRAAVDNGAMSAGCMFEINRDLLAPGEDVDKIVPYRNWITKGPGTNRAVQIVEIPSRVTELLELAQVFKQFGDETTTIPAYAQGEPAPGSVKTVGGLSMLMGASNITMKDTAKNFDQGITEPCITAMHHWNMQFNPDTTIKGDFEIKAIGASSLVAKELRAQQLENLAGQLLDPADAEHVNRRNLLVERFRAMDLDAERLMFTMEEVEKNRESQPPDPRILQLQIDQRMSDLKELIAKSEIALKARAQLLKEQEAAFEQRMAVIDANLKKVLDLRMSA